MREVPFVEFTPASVAEFNSVINHVMLLTERNSEEIPKQAIITWVFQAMKATPMARKGIIGRGFAKQAWIWTLRSLGYPVRQDYPGGTNVAHQYYEHIEEKAWGEYAQEVANQIPYILNLDRGGPNFPPQHIAARAWMKTKGKLKQQLWRLKRRQEQLFR